MEEQNPNSQEREGVSRRQFLQAAASVAAGGTLLAACGGSPPAPLKQAPAATTIPQAQVDATVTASVGKTYFPGDGIHVPDAFLAPLPPYQTVKFVPGTGKKVQVFSIFVATPATPKAQNKFWQALDKQLNVDWEITQVVLNDFATKAPLALNSNPPPDLFLIYDTTVSSILTAIDQGAFNDLTPYLGGDNLKNYPNLARIMPQIWKNSMFEGKIIGIPRSRVEIPDLLIYRRDWADKLGLSMPQNPDEFINMLTAFAKGDPRGDGQKIYPVSVDFLGRNAYVMQMFNVPNGWRLESDGSFTYFLETDEFAQSLAFEKRMWDANLYFPDGPTLTNKQKKTNFEGGKVAMYQDSFSAISAEQTRTRQVTPTAKPEILVPNNNQGKYNRFLGSGYVGITCIPSKATSDPERIKELLRIMDYLDAPTFSLESNFNSYGIDGWDSSVGKNGLRQTNDKGKNEVAELLNIAGPPNIFYTPTSPLVPQDAIYQQTVARQLTQNAVGDPTWGLFSPSFARQSTSLTLTVNSGLQRIVRGEDPLSALPALVKLWLSQGGAKWKQEYAASYHKVHG
ncbi:MAG TPA: substrate-binding domain-containing protein [Ktedonosporobacter sp.]|nr:substrate-binding domain-containing protein [Ktedonosporobacter sp.]